MESVIATREEIEQFLFIQQPIFYYNDTLNNGYSDGSGYGCGSCDSYGSSYNNGYGNGNGSGCGDLCCYSCGYGDGYGCGGGSLTGFGYSHGYNKYIKAFNGNIIDCIDNILTIIIQIHNNIAYGYIIKDDFTLAPCYIARVGNSFAHGETIKKAIADAEAKEIENMPIEERIKKFIEIFGSLDSEHIGKEFYDWHHILTGSCRMGRDEFCKTHDINLEKKYTVRYFLDITDESYGSNVIKLIREEYKI